MICSTAGYIKNARSPNVFVRYVQPFAIRAQRQLLGIGAHLNFSEKLSLGDVNNGDAIGRLVRFFVIIIVVVLAFLENRISFCIQLRWRGNGRATHRHVHELAIRRRPEAARSFAYGYRGHSFLAGAIDNGQSPLFFVRNKNFISFCRHCIRETEGGDGQGAIQLRANSAKRLECAVLRRFVRFRTIRERKRRNTAHSKRFAP